jgi:16S rRNA (cytidine1402-2'-O)-methyltransferase
LPADSFVYLGRLPQPPTARRHLLASVIVERRTLVALESLQRLPDTLSELYEVLGDRSLVVVASGQRPEDIWRVTLAQALEHLPIQPATDPCVLVIGGSPKKAALWDEDHLRAEIQARLDQGLGAKETSRELVVESGWPRREIYRLAVEAGRFHDDG